MVPNMKFGIAHIIDTVLAKLVDLAPHPTLTG